MHDKLLPEITLQNKDLLGQNLSASIDILSQQSATFCVLPFIHTYVRADGSLSPCCEAQETTLAPVGEDFNHAWNNSAYQKLRAALLRGEKPEICRKCWANEAAGLSSNRQDALEIWKSEIPTSPQLDFKTNLPRFLEIKCNNICNLKCRMCNPSSSFRVGEDQEIISRYRKGLFFGKKPKSSSARIKDLLRQDLKFFSRLQTVQFSGGEPLLSEEQIELVEFLSKNNFHAVELRYSTNLTNLDYKSFNYFDLWRPFKKVNVKVSADGIDDVFDYIRVGASFGMVKDNFDRLLKSGLKNLDLAIGFTTQAYNVFQLPEFLNFFESRIDRGRISTHLLHSPEIMSIKSFPRPWRERIIKKLSHLRTDLVPITRLLDEAPDDPHRWSQLSSYTEEIEKKQKIQKGFRELLEKYLHGY